MKENIKTDYSDYGNIHADKVNLNNILNFFIIIKNQLLRKPILENHQCQSSY